MERAKMSPKDATLMSKLYKKSDLEISLNTN